MFRLTDLTPPRALVCKTPTNPLTSMECQLLLGDLQGTQSHVYKSTISGVGDVLVKVLKPHLRSLKDYDEVVSLEVSLRQSGVPVAELLSYHEWNDFGMTQNAIIYRFYSGGDLFTQMVRLNSSKSLCAQRTEFIAYSLVKMLCTCLATLHSNGWIHADIKPENIFLSHDIESDNCQAYLGDFGMAVRIGTVISPLCGGTFGYFPKQDFRYGYGPAHPSVDIHCVGKLLFLFSRHVHKLSPHAESVIGRMTRHIADERPTAEEMLSTHLPEWFLHIDSHARAP